MPRSYKKEEKYWRLPNLAQVPQNVRDNCKVYNDFRVTDVALGEGSYGKVSEACKGTDCDYVAKEITFDFSRFGAKYVYNIFFGEALMTKRAGANGYGIPVHGFFLCDGGKKGVIVMDRYSGDLHQIRRQLNWTELKKVLDLVIKMHKDGVLHRDLFLKNIMYNDTTKGRKYAIIDFGLAIAFGRYIPSVLRAIDFVNLASGLPQDLAEKLYVYVAPHVGQKALLTAAEWKQQHYDKCSSEYYLLKYLPAYIWKMYGPAVSDLLVWSTRCSKDLDTDINRRIEADLIRKGLETR